MKMTIQLTEFFISEKISHASLRLFLPIAITFCADAMLFASAVVVTVSATPVTVVYHYYY